MACLSNRNAGAGVAACTIAPPVGRGPRSDRPGGLLLLQLPCRVGCKRPGHGWRISAQARCRASKPPRGILDLMNAVGRRETKARCRPMRGPWCRGTPIASAAVLKKRHDRNAGCLRRHLSEGGRNLRTPRWSRPVRIEALWRQSPPGMFFARDGSGAALGRRFTQPAMFPSTQLSTSLGDIDGLEGNARYRCSCPLGNFEGEGSAGRRPRPRRNSTPRRSDRDTGPLPRKRSRGPVRRL